VRARGTALSPTALSNGSLPNGSLPNGSLQRLSLSLSLSLGQFEKKHGDRQGIEDVIIGKRRFQYEEQVGALTHSPSHV
jgi:hypothetical protein